MVSTNTLCRTLWCLACGLALVLSTPAPAAAEDEPNPPELSAKDKRKARALVKSAKSHRKAADKLARRKGKRNRAKAKARYGKSAAAYRKAYQILRMPALLVPLGQVYQARKERSWALRALKKYVELRPEGPLIDDAKSAIDELETEMAEAKMAGEEEVAGEPSLDPTDIIGPEPEPEPVEPEEPEEPEKPDESDADDGDGDGDGDDPRVKPKKKKSGSGGVFKWSGIGAAALGAALVGTGIGFGVSAGSVADQLSANDDGWTEEDRALIETGKSRETGMYIFTSVGAAFIIGGATLFYLGLRSGGDQGGDGADKAAHNIIWAPRVTADGAALTVMGRF